MPIKRRWILLRVITKQKSNCAGANSVRDWLYKFDCARDQGDKKCRWGQL